VSDFETRRLPAAYDVIAPDGSEVRVLLGLGGGGMAHFRFFGNNIFPGAFIGLQGPSRSVTKRERTYEADDVGIRSDGGSDDGCGGG
jgi:hypothetical protein